MLLNCWLKDHEQTAENCQILYAKFHIPFKNLLQKIPRKFIFTFVISLALENFICVKPCSKLQSYSTGCSLANYNTKDFFVMQIPLIARSALTSY